VDVEIADIDRFAINVARFEMAADKLTKKEYHALLHMQAEMMLLHVL